MTHTPNKVGDCEEVNEGEIVMMEVDLRGEGRERTLHFFIEGRQQKAYFYDLPSTVEFCVCNIVFSFLFSFSFLVYHHLFSSSLQFYLCSANEECVEFVSLEEGGERMSKDGIEGESGYEF